MSGPLVNGGRLETEWPRILDTLLRWGTDIYVLDDKAFYGDEASGYSAPQDAVGTFFYDSRPEQEHLQGPFDGSISYLSTGTNNSPTYRDYVLSWFENH